MNMMTDWNWFAREVVIFADKLVVAHNVKMLASTHLFPAHQTGEAIQVENLVSRLPYKIRRIDSLKTAGAFRAVTPAKRINVENAINPFFLFPGIIFLAFFFISAAFLFRPDKKVI